MKYRVRMVEFEGDQEYPQGSGLTWDDLDVVLDIADDERIVYCKAYMRSGRLPTTKTAFNGLAPVIAIWLMRPEVST